MSVEKYEKDEQIKFRHFVPSRWLHPLAPLKRLSHVGLEDAEKELQKMQGLENARKEMGISDKDDKPLKQNMFKVI